jgi:hypothetical protein
MKSGKLSLFYKMKGALHPSLDFATLQRIQYAKTKSDIVAKADGTFVPRERRKRHDEKGYFPFPH